MHLTDTQWVPTAPEQTWQALRDPAVLQRCLTGCDTVQQIGEREYTVTLHARLGGARRDFNGRILITDESAPHHCHIAFEGMEAHEGLALGDAHVTLEPASHGGTRIHYALHGATGGPLATLPASTIESVGRRLVDHFFTAFADQMTQVAAHTPAPALATAGASGETGGDGRNALSWLGLAGAVVVIAAYYMFLR